MEQDVIVIRDTRREFYRTLIRLAIPIMIQNFLVSSLNMIDTLMIGAVGESEVAAVGIANQYYFLFSLIMTGVAGGCSMFVSQFWGKQDIPGIKKVFCVCAFTVLSVGFVFNLLAVAAPGAIMRIFSSDQHVIALASDYLRIVAFSYILTGISMLLANTMRSIGNARLPMLISFIAILINTALNYIFIFGKLGAPALGVRGAAIATLIARAVEMSLLAFASLYHGSPLRGKLKDFFGFNAGYVRKLFQSIVPVVLNDACWGLGFVMYTVAYGLIGTQAIAASQIANTVQNLFMVVCFSAGSSALVMTGNRVGAGQQDTAVQYSRRFARLALLIGLLLGVLLFTLSPAILSLFNVSEQVRSSAVTILRIFSLIAPIRVLNCILVVGVFRGGGDATFALLAEGLTMWFIGVPLAFIGAGALHLRVELVVLLICLEEVAKCAVSLLRLRGNRWIHDISKKVE